MSTFSIPKTLYRSYSDYSKAELIVLETGCRRVLGAKQISYSLWSSDPDDLFTDRYWGQAALKVKGEKVKVKKALILGLGGGTLAYLLNRYYAPERIDGVEIDPEIIKIGKQFFYLLHLPNLYVIQADAADWIERRTTKNLAEADKYDVIFMDLFQVEVTPASSDTPEFFRRALQLLNPGGILSLNKIFHHHDKKEVIEKYLKQRFCSPYLTVTYDRYPRALGLDNVLIYAKK